MQLHRDTAWYFFNLLEIPLGAFVTCCPQPLLYDTVWIPVTFLANILITCFSEWLIGWYCKDGYCNGRNVAYKSIIRHQFCYCEERFGSKVQGHSFLTFSSNEFELLCWGEEGMVRPRVQFPFGACDFLYGQFFEKKRKETLLYMNKFDDFTGVPFRTECLVYLWKWNSRNSRCNLNQKFGDD